MFLGQMNITSIYFLSRRREGGGCENYDALKKTRQIFNKFFLGRMWRKQLSISSFLKCNFCLILFFLWF